MTYTRNENYMRIRVKVGGVERWQWVIHMGGNLYAMVDKYGKKKGIYQGIPDKNILEGKRAHMHIESGRLVTK